MTDPEPDNPYAAPAVDPSHDFDGSVDHSPDDETRRLARLKLETRVRAIGLLAYLGATFTGLVGILGTTGFLLMAGLLIYVGLAADPASIWMAARAGGSGALFLALAVFHLFLGRGLRRFHAWARFASIGLCVIAIGIGITALVSLMVGGEPGPAVGLFAFWAVVPAVCFYVLLLPATKALFTPEHRVLVATTPNLRPRIGRVTKNVVILLLSVFLVLVLAVIAVLFARIS